MKNWINEDNVIGHCPWLQHADARAVADKLGIEFRVVNLMQDYRRLVVDYLLNGYQRGLTPNPDVMCNREMKFGVFLRYAQAEGFAAVATGHYAQRGEVARVAPSASSADPGRARPPGGPENNSLHGPLGDRPLHPAFPSSLNTHFSKASIKTRTVLLPRPAVPGATPRRPFPHRSSAEARTPPPRP